MPDKIKKLYDNIIGSGVVTEKDTGDFQVFEDALRNPENRTKLYKNLISRGLGVDKIGDEDTFVKTIGDYYAIPAPIEKKPIEQPVSSTETTNKPISEQPITQPVSQDTTPVGDNNNPVQKQPMTDAQIRDVAINATPKLGDLQAVYQNAWSATKGLLSSIGQGLFGFHKQMTELQQGIAKHLPEPSQGWGGFLQATNKDIATDTKVVKGLRDWADKDKPIRKEGFYATLGSTIPMAAVVVGSMLTGQPEILKGVFGASGYGMGLEAYDKNTKETGKKPNEATRTAAGIGYALVYTLSLGKYVDKFIPKGLVDKALGKVLSSNPQIAEKLGSEILQSYAEKSPGLAKQLIKNMGSGVLTMEAINGGQKAIDNFVIGRHVSLDEWKNSIAKSFGTGIMFSLMTAPFGMIAQDQATTQRRNEQGFVHLTKDENGNPVELIDSPAGIQGLTPDGKIVPSTPEMEKNAISMPTKMFNESINAYKKTGKVGEIDQQKVQEAKARVQADDAATSDVDKITHNNGKYVIQAEDGEGNPIFIKEGIEIDADGKAQVTNPNGIVIITKWNKDGKFENEEVPEKDLNGKFSLIKAEDYQRQLSDKYYQDILNPQPEVPTNAPEQPVNEAPVQPEVPAPEQPQQQEVAPQPETPPHPDLPVDKEGNTDYQALLNQDPKRFYEEISKKYTPEYADELIKTNQEAVKKQIATLTKKLTKTVNVNDIIKIKDNIEELTKHLKSLSEIAPSDQSGTGAVSPVPPVSQPEDLINNVKTEVGKPKIPIRRKSRGVNPNSLTSIAADIEPVDAHSAVLSYFARGGKLSAEGLRQIFEGENKLSDEERKKRISYISNKDGETPEMIAHHLWEDYGFDVQDLRNEVESYVIGHNHWADAAKELVNNYGDRNSTDAKFHDLSEGNADDRDSYVRWLMEVGNYSKEAANLEADKIENPDKYSEHVDKVISDNKDEFGAINDEILKELGNNNELPTEEIYNELFNTQDNGQENVNERNTQQVNSGEQKPIGSSDGDIAKGEEPKTEPVTEPKESTPKVVTNNGKSKEVKKINSVKTLEEEVRKLGYTFSRDVARTGSEYIYIDGQKFRLSDHYQPSSYQLRNYRDVNSLQEIYNIVSSKEFKYANVFTHIEGDKYFKDYEDDRHNVLMKEITKAEYNDINNAREALFPDETKNEQKKSETVKEAEKPVKDHVPEVGKKVKQPWEMTKDEYVNSKPKEVTVNGTMGSKPNPPEGKVSYYGRATLGGRMNSWIIEDTPKNREWAKRNKFTIARNQAPMNDYAMFHENFVEKALSEGKPVPEEVLKDYPDLAKKAEKGKEATNKGSDLRFKLTSPTEDAINAINQSKNAQKKGTPEQWKSMLLKHGAKQAELDWMGWDDFVKDKKSITDKDVKDWINAHQVKLEEVVKGDPSNKFIKNYINGYVVVDNEGHTWLTTTINNPADYVHMDNYGDFGNYPIGEDGIVEDKLEIPNETGGVDLKTVRYLKNQNTTEPFNEEDLKDNLYFSSEHEEDFTQTRHSKYTLPGGDNYKEWLLTMPKDSPEVELQKYLQSLKNKYKTDNLYELEKKITEDENRKWAELGRAGAKDKDVFIHREHFDEPNIVAFARTDDRTDDKGKKVFFIEEIQSDWAQKGREKGFYSNSNPKFNMDNTKIQRFADGYNLIGENGLTQASIPYIEVEDGMSIRQIQKKLIETANGYAERNLRAQTVPDMPFKKTPQWVGLALKRMVQEAAEQGFDKVAWTTGDQQNERWSLAKKISKIEVTKREDADTYRLKIDEKGGKHEDLDHISENDLSNYVGKELALKIIKDIANSKDNSHTYSGLDLKVGGEPMKKFYDEIVPDVAKKLFKKYGAKVGTDEIDVNGKSEKVNSITLTPELIHAANSGFPMFKIMDKPSSTDTPEYKVWSNEFDKQESDVSKEIGVKTHVVNDVSELPQEVQDAVKKQSGDKRFKAVYDPANDEIYLLKQNIRSTQEARETMLHEAVGHKGLRAVFGDSYDNVLKDIYKQMPQEDIDRIKKQYTVKGEDGKAKEPDNLTIADEYLAQKAETAPKLNIIQRAFAAIRDMVRKTFGLKYSDNDINNLFMRSRKALLKGVKTLSDYTEPIYSLGEQDKNPPKIYNLRPKGFMPEKPDMKDLGDFMAGKEDKGFYTKLKTYISDFAEKNGLKKPKLVSPEELPKEFKGTKEKVITDPKTGEKLGVISNIKTDADVQELLGKMAGSSQKIMAERAIKTSDEPPPAGIGWGGKDALRIGEQMLKEGEDPNKVIDAVNNNQKIDHNDVALVKAEIHRLQKATNAAEKTFGYGSKEWKEADAKEKAFAIKSKPVATRSSKMLSAFKGGENIETGEYVNTVSSLQRLNRELHEGKDFTPEQTKKAAKFVDDEQKLLDEYKEASKKFEEAKNRTFKTKTRKSFTMSSKEMADRIRTAKIHKPGAFAVATPASLAWDLGIEATAKSIELAGKGIDGAIKLANGVSDGIKAIKSTDWYKNLSKEKQYGAEAEFRDYHDKLFSTSYNQVIHLQKEFEGKTDNKFTPEQANDLWGYAKDTYIGRDDNEFEDVVRKVSMDTGLTQTQVINAFASDKSLRKISDDIIRAARERRRISAAARNWVAYHDLPNYEKIAKTIPKILFGIRVAFHGGVGMSTHAGMDLYNPMYAKIYFKDFFKQYALMGSPKFYERAMNELETHPRYEFWLRNGLAINPNRIYDDYQMFGKYFGKMGAMGDRGFSILKIYRLEKAEVEWKRLSETEQASEDMAHKVALIVNHSTGTSEIKVPEWAQTAFFAPHLELSRWQRSFGEPMQILKITMKGNDATQAEKAIRRIIIRNKAFMFGGYIGGLAVNAGLLALVGSKYRINFFHPERYDWLRFKQGSSTLKWDGGVVSTLGMIIGLADMAVSKPKLVNGSPEDKKKTMRDFLARYATYKFSPFFSLLYDLTTQEDFSGNQLPLSNAPAKPGRKKESWLYYITHNQLNIPLNEAFTDISKEMKNSGVPTPTTEMIFKGIFKGAIMGLTGLRIGVSPEPLSPLERQIRKVKTNEMPDYKKIKIIRGLSDEYDKTKDTKPLKEAVKKGMINTYDYRKIVRQALIPKYVRDIGRFHGETAGEDVLKTYEVANPEEKKQIRVTAVRKINRLIKETTGDKRKRLEEIKNMIIKDK